jgi:putative autotransporter adhesin-like protein
LIAVAVLAAIGVALLFLDVFLRSPGPGGARGSGVAATQTRALAGFSGLDLAGSSTVTVVVGGEQSVVVHADDNLLGHVTTRVDAGTLVIGSSGSFTTKSPMSVEVSAPSLQVLHAMAWPLQGSAACRVAGRRTRASRCRAGPAPVRPG